MFKILEIETKKRDYIITTVYGTMLMDECFVVSKDEREFHIPASDIISIKEV